MTRVAESEVVQMAIGEAAAAIDVATMLLHTGRDYSTAEVSSGRRITEAEALRARRDMVYAQHQVGWAVDRLCEMDGARWVYDNDELGAIRRDVMTILTHHAASRQAAMAPYGKMLLTRAAGVRPATASWPLVDGATVMDLRSLSGGEGEERGGGRGGGGLDCAERGPVGAQ